MNTDFGIADAVRMVLLPDGNISNMEEEEDEENVYFEGAATDNLADYDPYMDVNAAALEVEIERVEENNILTEKDNDVASETDILNADASSSHCSHSSSYVPQYRWRKQDIHIPDTTFQGNFSDPPVDLLTPMQYFKKFFADESFSYIAEQSNLYAMQKDGKSLNTTAAEIEQCVGIILLTGIFSCSSYRLYWATFCRFNVIADVMPRNRFELLLRYIHFNDNSEMKPHGHPDYDPMFKISGVVRGGGPPQVSPFWGDTICFFLLRPKTH